MTQPFEFPDWSDLGLGKLSSRMTTTWDTELMLNEHYRRYFDGDIFQTRVEAEVSTGEDLPLLYPVGINLVKMLCIAQADSTFGEWDDEPVVWGTRRDQDVSAADKSAVDLLNSIMEESNAGAMLWEHELERNVYGGGAIKISPVLDSASHIRWTRIPRQGFFPIWDPDNQDELLEVFVVTYMAPEQAYVKFKFEAKNDLVHRVEHWTRFKYENFLDKMPLNDYSGVNPWGIVPFVYNPRLRLSNWYGEPLTPDIMPAQDQLNMTVADISDAINYNAHPIRWGLNLPRDFNGKNFPLGPNAFWNLGRSLGNSAPPQVGMLEAKNAVAAGVFDFTKFVYDWSRTSSFAPPIAFGEDNGGGQRSGATLEIRMWPLIKAVRRSRAYLSGGLIRAARISALILKQKQFRDVKSTAVSSILERRIIPRFNEVLPRDQAAIVDEVVKLSTTPIPNISVETSQQVLGRGTGEVDRIKTQLSDKAFYVREQAKMDQQTEMLKAKTEADAKAKASQPKSGGATA